ncbi:hypothetical protein HHI36_000364 [Cryptolaemus montrouzieri]|uniref:Acyltransferase 3 domain-containing protein n=1 Tax=Cryptolaemus montrouzieri TaxID=559131 RepID=A0ABD2P4E7_9CUCU
MHFMEICLHFAKPRICGKRLNRYFRLLPVLAILVAALRSNVAHDLISYTNEDIMKREVDICRDYWWKNILFIQNIYEPDKICSSVTWYLATDYQLYLLTLGIFYISHKLKTNVKYLISLVVITTVATQVAIITNTDFQGFLRLVPKTANLEDMIVSKAFTLSYIPIWCNTITYMIGILFGTIYCNHKGEKIFNDNMKKIAWFFGFFGLPILAVFITSFQYDTRFFELLVSILARPMFGLGIGIGILGMASKTGGLVKMICESEILVFLANFCYCVYIFHYAFVFLRILGEDKLVELSIFYIAKYTLIDYTLSFSFGALMYMAVEHPFIQLQKMVFPQVTTKKLNFNGLPKSSISTVS